MIRYFASRLMRAAMTTALIMVAVFFLVRTVPGDPVQVILGDQSSPEDRAALREALHLDKPIHEQGIAYLADVASGSLGHSFRMRDRSVASLIFEAAPSTVELAIAALLVAWALALPLGVAAAWRRHSVWDKAASTSALLGLAIPTIWLGPLLILLFSVKLRWLPMPGDEEQGIAGLILPAITIGAAMSAILTRQTRAAMCEVLSEQYIQSAKARGVSTTRLLFVHALRNAMPSLVTIGAAQLGGLMSGAVIAEKVFERQGIGSLFLDAFFSRDIPVVQGCVFFVAVVYVFANLLAEVLYGLVDPRVRTV